MTLMTDVRAVILVMALVLVPAGAGAAPDDGAGPEISVTVDKAPVTVDTSQGHRRLRARMMCERPGALKGHYLGLSQATIDVRLRVQVYARPGARGLAGGVAAVGVELRLKDRTVYIARELPEDSCPFKAAMAHEMRHVAIDDALVNRFKDRLQSAVRKAAAEIGRVRGETRADLMAAVRAPLEAVLQREMAALRRERAKRHAAFDTAEREGASRDRCDPPARAYLNRAEDKAETWHVPVDCDRSLPEPQNP